ncbi:dynein regulatory complex protein 11-like [Agrilus planipennis]|uniref:Dynein regulatory complex protein 11-like n=1 Tax=Agrilus planipennis TaxID=224129 RepID=A0A1W4X4H8_AGRPL|nr:dynein regulatory complex protein 11-like [Agrilus planipennis]
MSNESYIKWWIDTKKRYNNLIEQDNVITKSAKDIKKRNLANKLVGGVYIKYCLLVQEIDACADQLLQPQQMFTIRKMLDAAIMRLKELKDLLVDIDISEYHYFDDTLIEMKLVPSEIEILHPYMCFPHDPNMEALFKKLQDGERIYEPPPPPPPADAETGTQTDEAVIEGTELPPPEAQAEEVKQPEQSEQAEVKQPEEGEEGKKKRRQKKEKPKPFVPPEPVLTEEEKAALARAKMVTEAVQILQTAERGRQTRLYVNELDMLKRLREAQKEKKKEAEPDPEFLDAAATTIQKVWRSHKVRKVLKRREEERQLLIGMTEPSWRSKEYKIKLEKTRADRRAVRVEHYKNYIQAIVDERDRILRVVAPGLFEDIGDEIRAWFHFWYDEIKMFDKYPPEKVGGSIVIVKGETMTPKEFLDDVEKKRREKTKAGDKAKLKAKEKQEKLKRKAEEKKKKEQEKKKKKQKAEARRRAQMRPMDFKFKFEKMGVEQRFKDSIGEWKELWDPRPFEENPEQIHYMDIITDEKCYEVQLEVRQNVDEMMRLELELLKQAWCKDKKKKYKAPKNKKGKGKKGKKGKKGARTIEDMFQELWDNGIIRLYPQQSLEDFKGDFSYKNWDLRQMDYDPPPCMAEVRHLIALHCILPLGLEYFERPLENDEMIRPKSVLIIGPRKCGKHLLANAIFNHTQCVLFDLSAPILAGKYEGKDFKKKFPQTLLAVARAVSPSILFIDGGEKPFYKKVPKPEREFEPKKLGKILTKQIVKAITPQDRVLVLGITNQPWAGGAPKIKKTYEKFIFIPRTDYNNVFMYWRSFLMPYHGVDRNIDLSCLTLSSLYYPYPEIKEAVEKTLVPARIVQLSYKPLEQIELLESLWSIAPEPVNDKEWKKFQKVFNKTLIGKIRIIFNKEAEKIREQEKKKKEKAKQGKK